MAKKAKGQNGEIVTRMEEEDGVLHAWDATGRSCFDSRNRERVVLSEDLRRYHPDLHIGQLGWTVPETTDNYKWVDVQFDIGVRLKVLVFGLTRLSEDAAEDYARKIIENARNTEFDENADVARRIQRQIFEQEASPYVDFENTMFGGAGDVIGLDEVYAFTFPSLQEIASLKQTTRYPVKIGYASGGSFLLFPALFRIQQFIHEPAGYPERPRLIAVWKTTSGRALETLIHRNLREQGCASTMALGREWFLTNKEEVFQLCERHAAAAESVNSVTESLADTE